jgi:hypothetical protein
MNPSDSHVYGIDNQCIIFDPGWGRMFCRLVLDLETWDAAGIFKKQDDFKASAGVNNIFSYICLKITST